MYDRLTRQEVIQSQDVGFRKQDNIVSTNQCVSSIWYRGNYLHEPLHNKTKKMSVRPAKTQISLGIRPV